MIPQRAPFDLAGRVVARREINLSRLYASGEEIPVDREGLTSRQLAVFWDQALIDTLPREAPVKKSPQQPSARR
ncbi:MAG TPA: hypothetical protein VFT22_07340 [Kofleriaceae bacterium]|nr:hypothetical protein [Kofleriaceae bacterium]